MVKYFSLNSKGIVSDNELDKKRLNEGSDQLVQIKQDKI